MPNGQAASRAPRGNVLLDALSLSAGPGQGQVALEAALEIVQVEVHEVIHEAGAPVEYVYFPLSAVFGLLSVVTGAPAVEVMPVGYEGMVGLPAVLGDGTSPHQVLCQVPGQAMRLPADVLRAQLDGNVAARRLLGGYIQLTVVLISERVACVQRHTAEQRCADWLLRHADQLNGQPFPLTQQFLATMLGLRRTTVSAIAARLQHLALISYRYGWMAVRDHHGLERLACSCYQLFRSQVDNLTNLASPPGGSVAPPQ